jgi:hypothetical protein
MPLPWCSWCKIRGDIDLSHRRHPSAAWDKSATNADGGFSCKRCWRCGRQTREVLGCISENLVRICSLSAEACQATQTHLLVRAGKSRRVEVREEEISYSLTQARSWPSQASRPFEVPARHGRRARSTQLQLACGRMTLLPPRARATREQGARDRVGHPRVGRARARRERSRWNGSGFPRCPP